MTVRIISGASGQVEFFVLLMMLFSSVILWFPVYESAGIMLGIYERLKIFIPITIVALFILIPVNVSDGTLSFLKKDLVMSDIDKLSISNVRPKSSRFFIHIGLEYVFTIWVCFMLYKEYDNIASMRLRYLASQGRRVDQFTVVVRNIPHSSGKSVSDSVDHFFKTNHPDHYLCHQRGFLGLCGSRVDSIEYYKQLIQNLDRREAMAKDLTEQAVEPNLNLKSYLGDAYLHPIFHSFEEAEEELVQVQVRVDKHQAHHSDHASPSDSGSEISSPSPSHNVPASQYQVEHNYNYQYESEHRTYYSYHYEGQP
ncbi:hypothetical protein SAY86_019947 [Trapa natans]|uniref:CSC1/OSCA1-like N-terminal transmembrane domain-containing protein n=1 Tax=Trapa natans TaxID=22666 RepID=A0AAN7R797_TRANT|nr:hypothetical protein SAY86_019947 [Trapa natans]